MQGAKRAVWPSHTSDWQRRRSPKADSPNVQVISERALSVSRLPAFDPAQYLDSEDASAQYLSAMLKENQPGLLAAELGDIARARGMSDIAKASGLSREALYKALRPDAKPRFDTIARVCEALGVKLVAQPIHS